LFDSDIVGARVTISVTETVELSGLYAVRASHDGNSTGQTCRIR
jgi:hypothetical protein